MVKFLKQRVNCDIFAGHCRIRWFSVDFWVRWPLGIESQNSETPIALKPKCNGWPPSVKWCDGYHRPSLDASHSVSVSVRRIFVLQTLGHITFYERDLYLTHARFDQCRFPGKYSSITTGRCWLLQLNQESLNRLHCINSTRARAQQKQPLNSLYQWLQR